MREVEKVMAYIYREGKEGWDILVFDHPGIPEVNPQVPAGTLRENEDPKTAVLREVFEESGLELHQEEVVSLGRYEFKDEGKNQLHLRHVFQFLIKKSLPEKWTHQVQSDDGDNGEIFDYYWLPLEKAKNSLVADQGKQLPLLNGHIIKQEDILVSHQNEELKIAGLNANFSKYFNLKRVAAHYFKIPSGYRTSEPHAESKEEEFVFVISGEIDLWLNGKIKRMERGDCIGFPAGTGVGHCFINNSGNDCELFVSGDRTMIDNQYHFHLDPSLKEECGERWWDDMPIQKLGGHDGLPGSHADDFEDKEIKILKAYDDIPESSFSYPGDDETFTNGLCLSRHFGMKSVAIWLEKMPIGKRASWPHAHSHEEEFMYVLEGTPTLWLDNNEYLLQKEMAVDFKAGSRVAHTVMNKSNDIAYYLCVGECENIEDKIFYPLHPDRNKEMKEKGALWE